MKATHRLLLAALLLALLMTGPFVLTGVLLILDADTAERAAFAALLVPRLPLGALITAFGFLLGAALLRHTLMDYVNSIARVADNLRLMIGVNNRRRIDIAADAPPEVRALARAANDLAQQRDALLGDVEAQVRQANATVETEKNRLAALMSELALGVVVCNLDGRILLYNQRARVQFCNLAHGPMSRYGGSTLIGLGRSIFSILERGQVAHALDKLHARLASGSAEPTAHFITATRSGQLLRAQMVPVLAAANDAPAPDSMLPAPAQITGYVLTTEDITRQFEREAERDQVLHTLTDGSRATLGNIRAAVETLRDAPQMDSTLRQRFVQVIADETTAMSTRLEQITHRFADSLKTRWPLDDVLGIDIVAAAARRIEQLLHLPTKNEAQDASLWLRADSFALIQAISFLAARLQDNYAIRELRLRLSRLEADSHMLAIDLLWAFVPVSAEALHAWELEAMSVAGEHSPLTVRDVIERHRGELWYQRDKAAHSAGFRLVLPLASAPAAPIETPRVAASPRPEYYDFDLFAARDATGTGIDPEQRLTAIAYTVFDTETTGLEPTGGDKIIQIGAVRIVNGRLLRQENFDQLVDPGVPLKAAGIAIHGITADRLRGQPTIASVLPAFHEFCSETVLVAHNAAFDMRFFQMQETPLGLRFAQPVLDTLLLSAVIHPQQESHRLESIAERLGVAVNGRHTALGDALVTGEIFLKMLPLLADMGIHTLSQALAAAQKTWFARVRY